MSRIVIGTLLLLSSLAAQATAASITVTSTIDAVDANPGDGTCATAAGTCSLRAAIQEANASPGLDDVHLPAGTFPLTVVGAGEDAAATGDLDVTQPLILVGAGQELSIIDGVGADRVVQVAANIPLTVRQLEIRNGNAGGPGGGIAGEENAPITINDVTFRLNQATTGGALIAVTAPIVMTGARFESNIAAQTAGALAHSAGVSALDIRDTVFVDNRALANDGAGGAIAYGGAGLVTIGGSTFQRNRAARGGAMFVGGGGVLGMTDSVVEDCSTFGPMSTFGGIVASGLASASLDGVTVRRNTTDGLGGGVVLGVSGPVTIANSSVDENGAGSVGGLYVVGGADVVVENTTVRGNRALVDVVAGMRLESTGGSVTVRDVAIDDNTAFASIAGAQVSSAGNVVIERTSVAGNAALQNTGGMHVTASGTITLRDSTVRANQGIDSVGGILLGSNGGGIAVENSTFAENVVFGAAGTGGGLVTLGTAPVTITNSTFSANWAQTSGAGLLTAGNPVLVASSTFFANAGGAAGTALATAGGGTATLRATVLGVGPFPGFPSCAGAMASEGNNLDQDGSCMLAGEGDRGGLEPELGPLRDNGGPTFTHEPLQTSPLVDAFTGAACPASDQRGVARPTDGNGDGAPACDVGAVEFVDECPTDPEKRVPGVCGCGVPDADANANGAIDCLINPELKARIASARSVMLALTAEKTEEQKLARENLAQQADDLVGYVTANEPVIVKADPRAKLTKLAKKARKALRATPKGKGNALARKQTRANRALDVLDAAVAP